MDNTVLTGAIFSGIMAAGAIGLFCYLFLYLAHQYEHDARADFPIKIMALYIQCALTVAATHSITMLYMGA